VDRSCRKSAIFRFAILVLLQAGCSSLQSPSYTYNEIVIINQTGSAVRDVAVSSTESGRSFSCGNIAPRGTCSNRFPPRPYRASPVQIDWMIGNGARHSKIIELTLPPSFVVEIPLRGVLVIDTQGQISTYLQQGAPGPHL
jgi:hypothetical protein